MRNPSSLGSVIAQTEAAVSAGDKAIAALNAALSGQPPALDEAILGITAAASALLELPAIGLAAGGLELLISLMELQSKLQSGANSRDIAASIVGVAGAVAAVAANVLPPPYGIVAAGLSIAAIAAKAGILSSDPWVPAISEGRRSLIDATALDPKTLLPKQPQGVNAPWQSALAPPAPRDPLAIDLDGDGIETVGIPASGNPVLFDHNADGAKIATGWLKSDDAWLVLDRDGNGSIDSGRELFGVDTLITTTVVVNGNTQTTTRNATSGFDALRALESGSGSANANNGIFDALDPDFARVRVWRDLNQDGISQAVELQTLTQAGIASIATGGTSTNLNLGNGNSVIGTAVVTRTSGSIALDPALTMQAVNLNLAFNPFYREFSTAIPLTDAARALPEMGGSGLLRDLREAMSLGTPYASKLVQAVDAFEAANTRDAQLALVDALLEAWVQTAPQANAWVRSVANFPIALGSVFANSRVAAALDAEHPGWRGLLGAANFSYTGFNAAAAELVDIARSHGLIRGNVMPKSPPGNTYSPPEYVAQVATYVTVSDMPGVLGQVALLQAVNGAEFPLQSWTIVNWNGFTTSVQAPNADVSALLNQSYTALSQSVYSALALQTRLRPYLDAIELVINGEEVRFDTTALNTLVTNQYLSQPQRGLEDLTELLLFAAPTMMTVGYDGVQQLRSWTEALPANSPLWAVLQGAGVRYGDSLTATERGEVLLGGTGNNMFNGLGGDDVIDGGAGNDQINGGEGADVIWGRQGVDQLSGGNSDDTLLGGDGNDSLDGGAGNDSLDGGVGSDSLVGGTGNDAYVVDSLTDVISETSTLAAEMDSVSSSVTWTLGSNLEALTLTGSSAINGIGNTLANALTGNTANNSLAGGSGNDTLNGGAGNDALDGGAGDDTYVVDSLTDVISETSTLATEIDSVSSSVTWTLGGNLEHLTLTGASAINGIGNTLANIITGNTANNSLAGGGGNDTLNGGAGNDALDGGAGDDTYVVDSLTDVISETSTLPTDIDTVNSSVSWALGANLENLTLTGTASINGTGNGQKNVITGNAGDNVLDGGFASDILVGGAGNDTYVVDSATDAISETSTLATEIDAVNSSVTWTLGANLENLTLTGTSSINGTGNTLANAIAGNSGNNSLAGGGGSDTLIGGAGSDTLTGGAGNDTYVVDISTDVIIDDSTLATEIDSVNSAVTWTLGGNLEILTLTGAGAVNGVGNALGNSITGNSGSNRLNGQSGNDTLTGGAGNDAYIVDSTGDVVVEATTLATEIDAVESSVTWTLGTNLENLTLTGAGAVNGSGNSLNNAITGNAGDNVLNGLNGVDTLTGGLGNDTYTVSSGLDVIIESSTLAAEIDSVVSSTSLTLGVNLESLTLTGTAALNGNGNSLNNTIIGNSGSNRLSGQAGNDTLTGGAGNDAYIVDSTGDVVVEATTLATEIDAVESSVTWTLGSNLENLTLTGTGAINGTGNSLDNTIIGNAGNNLLNGAAGTDTVDYSNATSAVTVSLFVTGAQATGGLGSDTLTSIENLIGSIYADTITGNAGNNVLSGGAGSDTLTGGAGNDTYLVDVSTDLIVETSTLPTEIDTVNSSATWVLGANLENLTLTGTASINGSGNSLDNAIVGNDGANYLSGGTGGASGDDSLYGGLGDDTLSGFDTDPQFVGPVFIGTFFLDGGAGADSLVGDYGNDTLNGGIGSDTLDGSTGNDTYVVDINTDVIIETSTLTAEIDTVNSSVSWTLGASLERLTLTGSSSINGTGNTLANTITGNAGSNALNGGAGSDTLIGGTGSDTYVVGSTGDVVSETSTLATEIDTVNSSVSWTLGANLENLALTVSSSINGTGNALNNTITGNVGNNVLDGGAGSDTLAGGAGDDTYAVGAPGDSVVEEAGGGNDTVRSTITYTLGAELEDLTLTGGSAVNGMGNAQSNVILGNSGANLLNGDGGNDTIDGGDGNDTLDGAIGSDLLTGGAGNDTYVVNISTDLIGETSTLAAEIDSVSSSVTWTLGSNFEKLTLTGTSAINGIGNSLANTITGNTGNNSLIGADGNDSLAGSDGRDTLNGGNGNDTLNGGGWDDTLNGGNGNDSYVVDSETDTIIETSTLATEIDRVSSSVSWTLGSTLEHLTLTGSSGTSGYGNAAANTIVGNQESNFLRGLGGNDTMDGGAGNDWLYGDDHADTYLFGRGSGQDVVVDSDFDVGPIDVVLLGAGVARTDVVFRRDFMSLEVVIAGSADKLVVQDWYFGMVNHIEQFRFADGTVITNGQIEGLLSTMAVFGATTTSNDPQVERSIQPWRHQGYATMLP